MGLYMSLWIRKGDVCEGTWPWRQISSNRHKATHWKWSLIEWLLKFLLRRKKKKTGEKKKTAAPLPYPTLLDVDKIECAGYGVVAHLGRSADLCVKRNGPNASCVRKIWFGYVGGIEERELAERMPSLEARPLGRLVGGHALHDAHLKRWWGREGESDIPREAIVHHSASLRNYKRNILFVWV